jgi:hypothetical protein
MKTSGVLRRRFGGSVALAAALAASPLAAADSAWYLAGKVGQAGLEGSFGERGFGWRVHGEDEAASLELGVTLHRFFAVQAGYHDLGDYPGRDDACRDGLPCSLALLPFAPLSPAEASFSALSLSAVPRWPLTPQLTLYGKLGVLDWEGDPVLRFDGQSVAEASDRDALYGLGARYERPSGWGVLVEYERSDLLDAVSLGTSWRF